VTAFAEILLGKIPLGRIVLGKSCWENRAGKIVLGKGGNLLTGLVRQ
jgi:hypothetical protein